MQLFHVAYEFLRSEELQQQRIKHTDNFVVQRERALHTRNAKSTISKEGKQKKTFE